MNDGYDFEYWVELYKNNPEEYERLTTEYLNDWIERHWDGQPEKIKRYKSILWRAQQEYRNIENPAVRAERAAQAMWSKFYELNTLLKNATKGGDT